MTGFELRPGDTLLVSRALDYLAAGPADVVPLIEHICQLPGAPRSVAEHMAAALFGGRTELVRLADGRWGLAGQAGAPADAVARPVADRLCDLTYAVVDVETTGGRPNAGDRITEVAAVVVRGGEVVEVFETLVNPQRPIPPFITSLTNITWDMVKGAPLFRDIAERLSEVMRGHVFVAHNASFDWRFVAAEFARATGEQLAGRRLCTVRLARKVLPHLPRRSLDHLARYYGVTNDARHRAAGDAIATARVLLRLLADTQAKGVDTWDALDALLGARSAPRPRRRRSRLPRPFDAPGEW